VTVPLDRRHRDGRTIDIAYQLFVHTNAGTATSTVWWNGGGPGPSTIAGEGWVPGYLLNDHLATFDVLFTDVRGTGSTAPTCDALQFFAGYWPGEVDPYVAGCAATIADRIDDYGSADSARDLEAVRAALRIPQLDVIGNSYGGMPATAYALRFPRRTRSLVLSSPVDPGETLATISTTKAQAFSRIIETLCARLTECRSQIDDPASALASGIRRLHRAPVDGYAISVNHTVPTHVTVTEGLLFTVMMESKDFFLGPFGEVPAALVALGRGDTAPILRLGVNLQDTWLTLDGTNAPASENSNGGYFAIQCSDYQLPWRRGLTPAARTLDALRAASLIPHGALGGWSATALVSDTAWANWEQLIGCTQWPDTNAEPVIPRGLTRFPSVPTLVMSSDYDTAVPLESARRTVARWPAGQLLDIGGAPHGGALWSCGPDRFRTWLDAPGTRLAPCDPADLPAFRMVGDFPRTASAARPLAVDPTGVDHSTLRDRRLARAAMLVALDGNNLSNWPVFGPMPGLRGGTMNPYGDDVGFHVDFTAARFTEDVAVDGTMLFPWDGSTPTIDITFVADDGTTGTLSMVALWNEGRSAAAPDVAPITGTIGGRPIALLMPL
jgi:pimeloyl-ACP methyl ester carboxylesterase